MIEQFPLPITTAAMEAKLADVLPEGDGSWQFEPKWDGFRCLAFKAVNEVDLRAKSGKPLGRYFPELVALIGEIPLKQFVVDGEILIATGGKLSFEALQMRLHPAESRIRKLSAETPAHFVLFDMLATAAAGNIMAKPLSERRAALEDFVRTANSPALVLSPFTRDAKEAGHWLSGAGHDGNDGVMAKHLPEAYQPGERAMIKVKRLRTADCVVGGFRYLAKKPLVGSLLLGLYDAEGMLNHVGFTSTIADEERQELTRKLEKLKASPGFTGKSPGGPSRWSTERSSEWVPLRPDHVVEVRYDHVTGERFRHGTKLLRWRPDKSPRQCGMDQIS